MVNDERYVNNMGSLNRRMQFIWIVLSALSILMKYLFMDYPAQYYLYIIPEMVFILSGVVLYGYERYQSSTSELSDERTRLQSSTLYYKGMPKVIFLVALGYTTSIIFINYRYSSFTSFPNTFINLTMLISFIVYYIYTRKNQLFLFEKHMLENKKSYRKSILKKISVLLLYTFGLIFFGFILYTLLYGLIFNVLSILLAIFFSGLEIGFWMVIIAIYEWILYHEKVMEEDEGKCRVLSKTYLLFGGWLFIMSIISGILHSFNTYLIINETTLSMISSEIVVVFVYLYYYIELTSIGRIFFIIISYLILYHSFKKAFPYQKHLHLLWLIFMFISLLLFIGGYFQQVFSLLSMNRILIGFDFIIKYNNILLILNLVSSVLFIIILFILSRTYNVSIKLLMMIITLRAVPFLVSYLFVSWGGEHAVLSTSYLIVTLGLSLLSSSLTFYVYYQLTKQLYTTKYTVQGPENTEAIPV